MRIPGLVIGAPKSGSGKTTVTLGLLRAFAQRGAAVAPFKCGPDYIDTAFHRRAAGRESLNLDSWAMTPDMLLALAGENTAGADLAIAEALMGFFDGVVAEPGRSGSSADVAAALGWPLILVLDVSGQAQTAAAIAQGFASYDGRVKLAGVILNKVGSERHRRMAADAIVACGLRVCGAIPRDASMVLPERHLGLVQAGEMADIDERLSRIAEVVAANVDLDAIRAAAGVGPIGAPPLSDAPITPPAQRIAVARDVAFSFLYPHLAAGWRAAGAELVFFSPLADEAPPAGSDFCWLPGGYPELHAGALAASTRFLAGLRAFAREKPVHGECGGYMVLGQGIVDATGARHAMAGLLGVETSFAKRRMHLGYRQATLLADHPLARRGAILRGHEFHYATVLKEEGEPFASVADAHGSPPAFAGLRAGAASGSFFHMIAEAG